ncbi:hypothetical protein HBI25_109020 [Parastagonospora nodorum]|nr:hypothetical protein HBH51_136860 [Parastagonospora nodorum]KAH3990663.1 hypothetical protein HBH52_002070 [Parastagonospora nodorum]KAH4205680.1 hypothetical protein HBI95_129950 [Parastagonospora nodorum]KAH4264998.1 hypothetical protein HBI03_084260 [Parastagonospora nodorum]KAH4283410.1 hypothetical protein HBI04_022670 [Parastagonospora nodorum]
MGGGRGTGRGAGGENSNGGAVHGAGRERSGYGGEGGQNAPSNAPTAPSGQGRLYPRGGFNQGGFQGQDGHLDPVNFRPPTGSVDQAAVGSVGILAKYNDCLWCRKPKGLTHLSFSDCSLYENCGFCDKGKAHRGLPCPRLYCSSSWWHEHFGRTPPNVVIRPTEHQRERLAQMDPFFTNFPAPVQLQIAGGQKRKREEDDDEVVLLKRQLETMTKLQNEKQQKMNEERVQREKIDAARHKAENAAAEARADVLEKVRDHKIMAEQVKHLLAAKKIAEDKIRDLRVQAPTRDDDARRAEQADSDRLLARARAEWEKEKQVAVQNAKDKTVEHIRKRVIDVQQGSNIEHLRRLADGERQKATQATADADRFEAQAAALEQEVVAAALAVINNEESNDKEQGRILPSPKIEEQ